MRSPLHRYSLAFFRLAQGGSISGLYRSGLADGTQFEVDFTYNGAATGYCQGAPIPNCAPDPTDNQR